MAGLDDNVAVMGEWVSRGLSPGTLFSSAIGEGKISKRILERELSLNYGQVIGFQDKEDNDNMDSHSQTNSLRGGLGQRIAARAGFNAPRLDTDNIRSNNEDSSLRLTISSPGISPATLLESPVFLSNPLAQSSPTTGKFPFIPGVNSNASLSSDEAKDEFFDDIGASFTFHPVSGSYGSQNVECSSLYEIETGPSGQKRSYDATTNTVESQDLMVGGGGAPAEDGYNWRKYGQKVVKGSVYPRSYYKCTNPNCQVKKKVERSKEGHITEITYKGSHNHSKPLPNRRSWIQVDGNEQLEQQQYENNIEDGYIQAQNVVVVIDGSSTFSNEEDEEDDRETQGSVSLGYDGDESETKRRKLEAYAAEMSGATRALREPRVVVQTTSDIDILDDGYRWRKYGQKVVKGNPNPRSYYKCTAPGCTVRKHVERASHDLGSVITTYEGKHDHEVPVARNSSQGGGSEPSLGRYERQVTTMATNTNQTSTFGHPFTYQPHMDHSFGLGQTGLVNMSMPGLAYGQGKMPVMTNPYLSHQSEAMNMMMMQRGMEPKVEPVLDSGPSVYNQIMSRLPQI